MTDIEPVEHEESSYTVGREAEKDVFLQLLNEESGSRKILNIYGTAGIGKSTLLDELREAAARLGAVTISVDGEGILAAPASFCDQIRRELKLPQHVDNDDDMLLENCYEAIRNKAMLERVVLFIDAYERFEILDPWIRDVFLKGIRANLLVIIAGRMPLPEPWLLSPVWRQQLVRMPLEELSADDVSRYARNNGIGDGAWRRASIRSCEGSFACGRF